MRASLVVITGTGTDVGKTHVAAALLRRASSRFKVCGFKPIESGVGGGAGADGEVLALATVGSAFHVKPPASPYLFRRAVSPHLAAREEGRQVALEPVLAAVETLRRAVPHVVVELAGGLFSPLAPALLNIDLAIALAPTRIVLVALDRLGVLHDVGACTRAAGGTLGAPLGIVLNAPALPDASTRSNGAELPLVTDAPLLATLCRADPAELARHPEIEALVSWCFES